MIKDPMVQDYFTYKGPTEEIGGGESLVETSGYIPANIQIEDMINAGIRLNQSRAEKYDFDSLEADDGEFIDPTRSLGFDMADASRINREVNARLRKQVEAAEAAKKAEAMKVEKKEE